MALITPESTCAICDEPLNKPYIATWGVAFGFPNLLYRYCDAPLHIDCVSAWSHRVEFSRGYYEMFKQSHLAEGGPILVEEDTWMLATCPPGPHLRPGIKADFAERLLNMHGLSADTQDPFCVLVYSRNWPLRLRTDWLNWDLYVQGGYQKGLSGGALEEARRIMTEVREYAPDLATLRSRLVDHQREQY